MEYLHKVEELASYLAGADHVDVKTRKSGVGLLEYVARVHSYSPTWVEWLFRARKYLAKVLGLEHPSIESAPKITPEEVPVQPGEKASFFVLEVYRPDRLWLGSASDKHLTGYIGVVVEPLPEKRDLYHLVTIVHYRNWMGPVYFNIIRPFHHLIVSAMASYAAKETGQ